MYKLTNMSLPILEVFLDMLSRKNMQKFKIRDGTRMSCSKFELRFILIKGKRSGINFFSTIHVFIRNVK